MKLYDLYKKNKALTFIDAATEKQYSIDDFHHSLDLEDTRGLVFLYSDNQIASIEVLLNFLNSSFAICLLSTGLMQEYKEKLEELYKPYYIYDPQRTNIPLYLSQKVSPNTVLHKREMPANYEIDSRIKLLISTSGTTGSPKFVKLSENNLIHSAEAILDYTPVTAEDVTTMATPFIFVYGFSVFSTNCMAGGTIICTPHDVLKKEFWTDFNKYHVTNLSGVPYTYEMLHRIGFFEKRQPTLKYLTQSGGALNQVVFKKIVEYAQEHNVLFFTQYGQTEGTGRMSFLPPEYAADKICSIGRPIKGGEFEIDKETDELIYRGPNVFGGYANEIKDLASFDQPSKLYTGDLAKVDKEGFYYITGRIKRIVKLFGTRYNLDEIELILKNNLGGETFICMGEEDKYLSVLHLNKELNDTEVLQVLRAKLNMHPSKVKIGCLDKVPLTPNGKVNYKEIVSDWVG